MRYRVLILGEPHYDKGHDWWQEHAERFVYARPRAVLTLQEAMDGTADWHTIAETQGEDAAQDL